MLQNTSQGHKPQAPHMRPRNQIKLPKQQAMIATQNLACNRPTLATLSPSIQPSLYPAPSATHYHTPPPTQYPTTIPLYPNTPPLHAIPFATSSSSTTTQFLHLPKTSTHYPTFLRIVIKIQSHPRTSIPRMGTSKRYKMAQL